jgi:predicted RNA-binding Zn ribbon-like protein
MVSTSTDPQAAPGLLEQVRGLLNTWVIPNDSRVPVDQFDAYRRRRKLRPRDAATLRDLRDDLRAVVEGQVSADATLTEWIERLGVRVVVMDDAVQFRHGDGPGGEILVVALDAVATGRWSRLKACPDCHWAFYDRTRSGTKRWCLMNAGSPTGRGCGNIAKARRHRARQKAATPST